MAGDEPEIRTRWEVVTKMRAAVWFSPREPKRNVYRVDLTLKKALKKPGTPNTGDKRVLVNENGPSYRFGHSRLRRKQRRWGVNFTHPA